jgi:hypothetical protein
MTQLYHEPILGDSLHPSAAVGDELTGCEQSVIVVIQRTKWSFFFLANGFIQLLFPSIRMVFVMTRQQWGWRVITKHPV